MTSLVACTIANNVGGTGGFGGDGVTFGGAFARRGGNLDGIGGTGGIFTMAGNLSTVTLHNVLVAQNIGMAGGAGGHGQDTNLVVYQLPPGTIWSA